MVFTMRTNQNIKLPSELWLRMSDMARAEGKSIDDLLEEAALRLLELRGLRSFVAENRELAVGRGLTERDVSRLIAESRGERSGQ
jgi:hypothetical protein